MWTPWKNRSGAAKVLLILVTLLLIASGLCGMQLFITSHAGETGNVILPIFMVLGSVELFVIFGSAVVLSVPWFTGELWHL